MVMYIAKMPRMAAAVFWLSVFWLVLSDLLAALAAPCCSVQTTDTPRLGQNGAPWGQRGATAQGEDYMLGIKRVRRLYCNVGIGFHIQVSPNGKIRGAHDENRYTLLEISPVKTGVVTLFGLRSSLFIAMTGQGKLYGSGHYNNDCDFKESLLANNYNSYESATHPGMYIGLSKTGKTKRGNRLKITMTMAHFLPRI